MVDKVWYDWQHADAANFWAFHGGTTQGTQNLTYYDEYPSGGPPMLSVRHIFPITLFAIDLTLILTLTMVLNLNLNVNLHECVAPRYDAGRWHVRQHDYLQCHEHDGWILVLHLRVVMNEGCFMQIGFWVYVLGPITFI